MTYGQVLEAHIEVLKNISHNIYRLKCFGTIAEYSALSDAEKLNNQCLQHFVDLFEKASTEGKLDQELASDFLFINDKTNTNG